MSRASPSDEIYQRLTRKSNVDGTLISMECKNCGTSSEGNFCLRCGQRMDLGRITFSSVLKELSRALLQFDRGLFFTVSALWKRPGKRLNDYLRGQRKPYVQPITYVLLFSTLYFILTQFTQQSTWMDDFISGWIAGASGKEKAAEVPTVLHWFARNYAYATLLLLPVFALASYWAFRRYGLNYAEHIVLNAYVTGQQAMIYVFFVLVGTLVSTDWMEFLPFVTATLYLFWVFHRFFPGDGFWVKFARTGLTYVLYLILSAGLLFGLTALGGFN